MTTTTHPAHDPIGPTPEADGALGDNDDVNPGGQRDPATSTVRPVVDQDRWHYYHVSTP